MTIVTTRPPKRRPKPAQAATMPRRSCSTRPRPCVEAAGTRSGGQGAGCRVLVADDPVEVILSRRPRKQGPTVATPLLPITAFRRRVIMISNRLLPLKAGCRWRPESASVRREMPAGWVLPALAPGGQRGVNQAGDAELKLAFPLSMLLSC
jgi:hypothetical protein